VNGYATADAIRAVRSKLSQMISQGHVVTKCWPECSVLMVEGLNTARAMEHLAGLPVRQEREDAPLRRGHVKWPLAKRWGQGDDYFSRILVFDDVLDAGAGFR